LSWHILTLSAAQVAAGKVAEYREAFEKAFTAARGPRTMALFQRESDGGGLDLYLTPECGQYASDLLQQWTCSPCDRPSLVGLHLLVGHSEITYYLP